MWLTDEGMPQRVISFTISGGHMNWMAALIGSIIHDWNFDGVLLKDGSSHGMGTSYHYSWEQNGRPESYDPTLFRAYLESCAPIHGSPTIHYEGIATRKHADQWNEILDDLGDQDDVLVIPTLAANLQEAIYCMLNIVTKNVIDDQKYLEIVTGVKITDDESMHEASRSLLSNWSLMSGASIPRKPKQYFFINDIINNDVFITLKDNLCRIFNKSITEEHVAMVGRAHRMMFRLNKLNWQISQSLTKHGPDDRILNLKPGSLILKTLNLALKL